MEEVQVKVEKVQAPIPIPKLDLGFGSQCQNYFGSRNDTDTEY